MKTGNLLHVLLALCIIAISVLQAQDTWNVRLVGYGLAGNTVWKYGDMREGELSGYVGGLTKQLNISWSREVSMSATPDQWHKAIRAGTDEYIINVLDWFKSGDPCDYIVNDLMVEYGDMIDSMRNSGARLTFNVACVAWPKGPRHGLGEYEPPYEFDNFDCLVDLEKLLNCTVIPASYLFIRIYKDRGYNYVTCDNIHASRFAIIMNIHMMYRYLTGESPIGLSTYRHSTGELLEGTASAGDWEWAEETAAEEWQRWQTLKSGATATARYRAIPCRSAQIVHRNPDHFIFDPAGRKIRKSSFDRLSGFFINGEGNTTLIINSDSRGISVK
ncbi:MAG: hypothetical protein GF350_07740 [Chitinivibrionales bacterium]|nr:hypothetical protein [Chitinivibrionales bacterium]